MSQSPLKKHRAKALGPGPALLSGDAGEGVPGPGPVTAWKRTTRERLPNLVLGAPQLGLVQGSWSPSIRASQNQQVQLPSSCGKDGLVP